MAVTFTAGQKVRALDLLKLPTGVIARNVRTTNLATAASTAATAQRVLSTAGSVEAGQVYRVTLRGHLRCSAVDATAEVALYYTTNGAEPTTSSTLLAKLDIELGTVDVPEHFAECVLYVPATSHVFTVVAAMHRAVGAGTLTAAANEPGIELVVEALGGTVATSGTIY